MGYYLRFVSIDPRPITAQDVQQAFAAAGPGYTFELDDTSATINHSGFTLAHVEINVPGDGLFDAERDELVEFVNDASGDATTIARVLDTLRTARAIVATRVLFGSREPDATLDRLDPLWTWLWQHRDGLLQADGEGWYNAQELLLEVE